jgi:hypothetical protein
MPRINRDLQRRMAARRDRERRKPSPENRYRFATPESAIEADEAAEVANGAEPGLAKGSPGSSRQSRTRRGTTLDPRPAAIAARGAARPEPLPFSAYAAEYAYVLRDLRRVSVVIGSLLLILIVLYLVLPH